MIGVFVKKMSIYAKKPLLDIRYQLLASSSIYTYDDDNLTSYADFLKYIFHLFKSICNFDIDILKKSNSDSSFKRKIDDCSRFSQLSL